MSAGFREQGNALFKEGKFQEAAAAYSRALEAAIPAEFLSRFTANPDLSILPSKEDKEAAALALSNRAACWLKLSNYPAAIADTSAILEIDGGNTKALYRRAQAYQASGNVKAALQDASRWLQVDPKNETAASFMRGLRSAATGASAGAPAPRATSGGATTSTSSGSGVTSPSSASNVRLALSDCVDLLAKLSSALDEQLGKAADAGARSSSFPVLSSTQAASLAASMGPLLASLPPALKTAPNAKAFLSREIPSSEGSSRPSGLLFQLLRLAYAASSAPAPATPASSAPASSTSSPLVRALGILMGVCRSVAADQDFAPAWLRDWSSPGGAWNPPSWSEDDPLIASYFKDETSTAEDNSAAPAVGAEIGAKGLPSTKRPQGPEVSLPPQCSAMVDGFACCISDFLLPILASGTTSSDATVAVDRDEVYRAITACVAASLAVSSPFLSTQTTAFLFAVRKAESERHKADVQRRRERKEKLKKQQEEEQRLAVDDGHVAPTSMGAGAGATAAAGSTSSQPSAPRLLPFAFVTLPSALRSALYAWARFTVRTVLRSSPRATPINISNGSSSGSGTVLSIGGGVGWDYSGHEYCLKAISQLLSCGTEDGIWLLAQAGAFDAALALSCALPRDVSGSISEAFASPPSSSAAAGSSTAAPKTSKRSVLEASVKAKSLVQESAASVRKTAAGFITRAFAALREAHPAGYAETGKAKLRLLIRDLLTFGCGPAGLSALAKALPFVAGPAPPASASVSIAGGQSEAEIKQQQQPRAPEEDDDSGEAPPEPDWSANEGTARATCLLGCLLLADRLEALSVAGEESGVAPSVVITSASPHSAWQSLAVEVVSSLTNDEDGRNLLTGMADRISPKAVSAYPSIRARLDVTGLLARLMESRSAAVRSGASITLAKLTSPAKVWGSESGRSGASDMIVSVFEQLEAAAGAPTSPSVMAALAGGRAIKHGGEDEDDDLLYGGADDAGDGDDDVLSSLGGAKKKSGSSAMSVRAALIKQRAGAFSSVPFVIMLAGLEEAELQRHGAGSAAGGAGATGAPFSAAGLAGASASKPVVLSLDSALSASSTAAGAKKPDGNTSILAKHPILRRGVQVDAAAKAVEALAVLATHTKTKGMLAKDGLALASLLRIGAAVCHGLGVTAASVGGPRNSAAAAAAAAAAEHDGIIKPLSSSASSSLATSSASELRPAAYGIAFILYSITVSRSRQREEKLAEMEIDIQQYRELQKLLAPGKLPGEPGSGKGGAGDDDEEEDPPSAVEARAAALAAMDVVPLLHAIVEAARVSAVAGAATPAPTGASASKPGKGLAGALAPVQQPASTSGSGICEMVSRALLNLAEFQPLRGKLVAAGAIKLLLSLCCGSKSSASASAASLNTQAGVMAATQALARLLITTHSSSLSLESQLDAIPPMLRVLRESNSNLAMFECLLALTNLASASEEGRQLLLEPGRGGVEAIEYCQFSENTMLRRAATEALTNLAATDKVSSIVTDSRLPLWLALAAAYERGGDQGKKSKESDGGKSSTAAGAAATGPAPPPADINSPEVQAKLKKLKGGAGGDDGGSGVIGEEEDTPTALAAAGALAMAMMHIQGQAGADEGEDLEEDNDGRGGRKLDPKTIASVKAQREARRREREQAAVSMVERTVDGGAARVVGELLLSGRADLQHRGLVIADHMARYARGQAALLTPLIQDDEEEEGLEGGAKQGGSKSAKGAAAAAPSATLSSAALLVLLSEGKDPSSMMAGRKNAATATAGGAGVPPPLRSLAAQAALRILEASKDDKGREALLAASKAKALPAKTPEAPAPAGVDDKSPDAPSLVSRELRPVFMDSAFVKEAIAKCKKIVG